MLGNIKIFGINFDFLDVLMIVMIIGCGLYAIYTAIRVKREYMFFENKFLLPGNCKPEDCTDPEGFFDFIAPRMLFFGISLILCGILDAFVVYMVRGHGIGWMYWLQMVPVMAVLVWFVLFQKKASKEFW